MHPWRAVDRTTAVLPPPDANVTTPNRSRSKIMYRKRYRPSSTARRGVSDKEEKLTQTQCLAAVLIQSMVRMALVRKRCVRGV